ncbi:HNH endonuclease [Burkholderia ubonensis]|uniref:HNH endonuclease n=1 Tax=Burkholderia ubonensis TaxID=101571 RepID=UPI0009B3F40F|nr:HNH endonuclease [Burkholderia ubonensis]
MTTIKEAALMVMRRHARPMTFREVYDAIIEAGAYEFNSPAAAHIVQVQIRRHCEGVIQKGSSPKKIFSLVGKDLYVPLEDSEAASAQHSPIDQDLLRIIQRGHGNSPQPVSDANGANGLVAFHPPISTTTKRLIDARLGQGKFRLDLERIWNGRCAVTGCQTKAALRASHIKPWATSTDEERLDGNNGLLLIATLDALFDQLCISFSDAGEMLISKRLPKDEILILGARGRLRKELNVRQLDYISEHRARFKMRELGF